MRYLRLCLFVVLSFLSVTVKVSAESQDSVLLGLYGDSMEKGDVPDAMDAAAVILSRIDSASVDVQTAVIPGGVSGQGLPLFRGAQMAEPGFCRIWQESGTQAGLCQE